ncbi:BQ2448_643 [Microbotryum intermedium]|uniref:DNA ligase n=1 Tax=Microbotryum intermedium TaxID=269621 RepID=A0A238F305_9BASI|nr:BQ2448_643 [Microbotryum intermedium]
MSPPDGVGSSGANGLQATHQDHEGEEANMPIELDDFPRPLGIENRTSPLFIDLVQMVFVKIEKMIGEKKKHGKHYKTKRDVVWEYFSGWREHVGPDTYPVVRLLLPDRDTRRGNYNLKEQKLAKALLKTMGMSTEVKDARALINWKVPDTSGHHPSRTQKSAGDFASVAFGVIDMRSTAKENGEPQMTVDEINALLDRLVVAGATQRGIVDRAANASSQASGSTKGKNNSSSLEQVADVLTTAYERLQSIEFKWLIRIILRDLKLGMSERVVLGAMHPDAVDLFNTCSDILRVCWELHDPKKRVASEHKEMTVGRVFAPMLCGRLLKSGFDSVVHKMRADRPDNPDDRPREGTVEMSYWCKPKEFLIEEKFDGERIQVHKEGDMYTYYSRKSTNYTYLYGKNPQEGSITPFIHEHFHRDVKEAVLDAEMLVWDPQNSAYVPFGQLKSFAAKTSFGPNDPRPCLKVFDVLYIRTSIGCQSLLKTALWRRKALIHKVIKSPVPGVLEIAEVKKISTADEISDFLKVMLEERGEGMVVKNPYSYYQLGGRELTWLKIKPDYMDQLGTDLDALVVGAYWGQGRRGGTHASFMLGVRDPSREEDGNPFFRSFAKVGTGFNRELFQSIRDQTQGKWFDYNRRKLPNWFSTNSEAPDQLIHPKELRTFPDYTSYSFKATEVVLGKDYGAGWTLRFPRCMGVRDDKDWTDSATLSELEAMQAGSSKRMQDSEFTSEGKKRKTTRTTKPTGIMPVVKAQKVDELFKGMAFYVHHMRHSDRADIHAKIKAHGGEFRQAPSVLAGVEGVEERFIVASEWKNTLTRMQGAKEYDSISPQWIVDSIEAGERVALRSKYYVNCLESTRRTLEALEQRDTMLGKGLVTILFDPSPSPSAAPSSFKKEVEILSPKQEEDEEDESTFTVMRHEMADSDGDSDHSDGEDRFRGAIHDQSEDDDDEDEKDEKDEKDENDEKDEDKPKVASSSKTKSGSPPASAPQSSAVEELEEAHHDPESIFGQYVAYFDTSTNARENNLSPSQKVEASQVAADEGLMKAQKIWEANAGRMTNDLLDPDLTHIILDAKIKDRISEMIDCTSKPRYRHLVTPAWIEECVDSEALVDEQDFRP